MTARARLGRLAELLSRPRRQAQRWRTVEIPIAGLYSRGLPLTLPVHVLRGVEDGPVLLVCAAVHGDELNGVQIVRRLLVSKHLRGLRGTLLGVPVVNVLGFLHQSRYLPDRRDLNRSFPGRAQGSHAARLAHLFMTEVASLATHAIDLHTGAVHRANLPHVRGDLDQPAVAEMAGAFGVPVMVHANVRDGSLRAAFHDADRPALIFEAGEALRVDPVAVRVGVHGVLRVMHALGMLERRPRALRSRIAPVLSRSTSWVRAPEGGVLTVRAHLGDRVAEGQRLGTVGDPFGRRRVPVRSTRAGIVIGEARLPLVHEGDALFHIARAADDDAAGDALEAFQHEYALHPPSTGPASG
ncbi:MAG: succinylglutamate desuccinylase/aspartoacylase family protein [Sandaracinaceae bacterium]